jgi:hypothetical protein
MNTFPWLAGMFVVPAAGALLTRLGGTALKTEQLSQIALLGAAAHGAVAVYSYYKSHDADLSPDWQSFAKGGMWGEIASSALLLWAWSRFRNEENQPTLAGAAATREVATGTPFRNAPILPAGARPSDELVNWLAGRPRLSNLLSGGGATAPAGTTTV